MATAFIRDIETSEPAAPRVAKPFLLADAGTDEGGTLGGDVVWRVHGESVDVLPVSHPDRIRPVFQVRKALRHFRNVIRDKEQTDEIIGVFDALPWRQVGEEARKFLLSSEGRAIYQAEPSLPEILDDHATLRRAPQGSFGHAYCDFMEREGLTAAGMVEASGTDRNGQQMFADGIEWYGDRLRDTHDLLHILTGYGRDTLGEQCVLAYLYAQRPSPGHAFIAWAGAVLMKLKLRSKAPVWRAMLEARRHGKLTRRIVEQPIVELLAMPLVEVRRMLNVPEAKVYNRVHEVWRAEGIDPHAFLAAADA